MLLKSSRLLSGDVLTMQVISEEATPASWENDHEIADRFSNELLDGVLSNLDTLAVCSPASPSRDVPDMLDDIFHEVIHSTAKRQDSHTGYAEEKADMAKAEELARISRRLDFEWGVRSQDEAAEHNITALSKAPWADTENTSEDIKANSLVTPTTATVGNTKAAVGFEVEDSTVGIDKYQGAFEMQESRVQTEQNALLYVEETTRVAAVEETLLKVQTRLQAETDAAKVAEGYAQVIANDAAASSAAHITTHDEIRLENEASATEMEIEEEYEEDFDDYDDGGDDDDDEEEEVKMMMMRRRSGLR